MDLPGYGDSSHTADGKYIIASFRADANLGWVVDLRTFLNIPELKYKQYAPLEKRNHVAANRPLYRNVITGLSAAELTIIDREKYSQKAQMRYTSKGATLGEDFGLSDVFADAARDMILDSPLGIQVNQIGSPMMQRMFRAKAQLQELPASHVTTIHERSGGKLKDAIVISARAHSMLSPTEFQELRDIAKYPYMQGMFAENKNRAAKLGHVFDHEHPKSLPILNELVSRLAQASGIPCHVAATLRLKGPVREESSATSDHIQAADFAAGWAADLLTSTDSDFRALAAKVRWVSVNGIVWPA